MSFKKFSSAQNAPGKDGSDEKSKETTPAEQPAEQSDPKPAEVAPASK
ncbi:MAG TPA: hypothetical protein VIS03_14735 [Kiloniellaceae bacterium]